MKICAETKLSDIIQYNPKTVDVIASMNPLLYKLKNPMLRKVFARRVKIADAAWIGKTTVEEFIEKLLPMGFTSEQYFQQEEKLVDVVDLGDVEAEFRLDIREDTLLGIDTFEKINQHISFLKENETLLLINIFEPIPLTRILQKRDFKIWVSYKSKDLVYTYIRKAVIDKGVVDLHSVIQRQIFKEKLSGFGDNITYLDVRRLEMPLTMVTIMQALDSLDTDTCLFVYHNKLPMFLLAILEEKKFEYALNQINDSELHLLIYR